MRSKPRKVVWAVASVALSVWAESVAGGPPGKADVKVASGERVPASSPSLAIIETLIDDAMADGTIGADERNLILSQARRRLSAAEVAGIEARLTSLPAARAASAFHRADDAKAAVAMPGDNNARNESNESCCDEPGCGDLWDNMYIFGASDGWMGPIDDVDGNNFGLRLGFNLAKPLSECRGIAGQVGMSYGVYNFHGRFSGGEQSSIEEQLFITAGVFKRADLCAPCPSHWTWGVVVDQMITDNLGEDGWEVDLSQLRWLFGYAMGFADEVGIMGSFRIDDDEVDGPANNENAVSAIDQASVFWHHKWPWSADTTVYTGIVEDVGEWIFGAKGEVPISNCVSLLAGAHYILPSTSAGSGDQFAQEIWNVTAGVAYYPGGNAVSKNVTGRRWMPLLPVADNGSFAIDVNPDRL